MASIISVDTLQDSAGSNEITTANVKTAFDNSAKVYAQFAGDGTAVINESFNSASLTDNGSGLYTLNFTNNMSSADFTLVLHAVHDSSFPAGVSSYDYSRTTGDADINTSSSAHNSWSDCGTVDAVAFGDLA